MNAEGWQRGDVVAISDPSHPGAACVLTSEASLNAGAAWFLVDDRCAQWRSTDWIEAREPVLLVRDGQRVELAMADIEPLGEDVSLHTMRHFFTHKGGRACSFHSRLGVWVTDSPLDGAPPVRCLRDHSNGRDAQTARTEAGR